MMRVIACILAFLMLAPFEVQAQRDKNQPVIPLWGGSGMIHYDEQQHVWFNRNFDNFVVAGRYDCAACWKLFSEGYRIPVKKKYTIHFVGFFRHPEHFTEAAMGFVLPASTKRRFVGINVEGGTWEEHHKVWPHLGLLYVGTIAKQEGFDVVLHDEFIQGPAPLETLIEPGDIVGLSLLTTGIDRGVDIARLSKELGASMVVAGNDSAMFRAPELLSRANGAVDAVFTTNSLLSMRKFFRQGGSLESVRYTLQPGQEASFISNESIGVAFERKKFGEADFFTVPDLALFPQSYWDSVWSAYRNQWGHKHGSNAATVKNGIALFGQGCGRAYMGDICEYCTIRHVANVSIPSQRYLEETLGTYKDFGIDTFFNTMDSAFEFSNLADRLNQAGSVDSLVMYGRAQPMAQHPELFDKWLRFANKRLLINCGIDSADRRILHTGINKSGSKGDRLEENKQAIRNVKAAGPTAHLHFSLIFGSPGETEDSCKANLDFLQWAMDTLGEQLDVVEGDIFWVNFGAPASSVFTNYDEAVKRAALADKTITREQWHRDFAQYKDELSVPLHSEKAWYQHFTNISYERAHEYNAQVKLMMDKHEGRIAGREFGFKPPPVA